MQLTNIDQSKISDLNTAILSLQTDSEAQAFLRDLLTEAELKEFSARWTVAQLLSLGIAYSEIEKQTGMSSTTIARISKWLNDGMGGYRSVINKLNSHHNHHSS